jgi:chemotaxis signal transduction protein
VDAVVFQIGDRRCSLELQQVEEVIRLGPVTPVPAAAPTVLGAMNLRGQVVAVLDAGALALGSSDGASSTTAVPPSALPAKVGLLVQGRGCRVVLCVDRVEGVVPMEELASPMLDLDGVLDRLLGSLSAVAGRWTSGEADHE